VYVDDDNKLGLLCEAIGRSPLLAVDTEFMRERTYYARLCLIQVATSDVAAIIDPLAVKNLKPLASLLTDDRMLKVFHAGQQDLEIFYQLIGQTVRPVFDTQIAATLAGFPQQVSYRTLVNDYADVDLDKSDTYTDWAQRPLSTTQIEYALNDVRYLPAIYSRLVDDLHSANRMTWLEQDFERLVEPTTFTVDSDMIFLKTKKASSLNRRQLGVLQKVAAWREREAQKRDMPRRWVLTDESLVEIARRAPSDIKQLLSIRGAKDKVPKAGYPELLSAIAEGLALDESELPGAYRRRRRPAEVDGVVELMAALVRVRAKEHNVAAASLGSREDIEALAAGDRDGTPLLQGWRRALVGNELLQLLEGKVSISVADNVLSIQRIYEDAAGDIEDGTHLA